MISAAVVFSVGLIAQLEQAFQAAAAIGQRALALQLDLRRRELLLQAVVLRADMAQADVTGPDPAHARGRRRDARWTSANTPKVTASRIGTPVREFTWAEIRST